MKTLNKFIYLLSTHERRRIIFLLFTVMIMAFIEMLGLASILPFIGMLSNPDILNTNKCLGEIFNYAKNFGVDSENEFIFFISHLVPSNS